MANEPTPTRAGERGKPVPECSGLVPRFVTICTSVAVAVGDEHTPDQSADVLYGLDVVGRVWMWCDANSGLSHEGSVAGWLLLTNKVHVPGKKAK